MLFNQKTKKTVYIILFTFLGVLLSFLAHAGIEIWYINLLVSDFQKYGLGLSWGQWYLIHGAGAVILFVAGVWFGFWQGGYWWKRLYEKN